MLIHFLWSGAQTLYPIVEDEFGVDDFPERRVRFNRDSTNAVVSFELKGIGGLDGMYQRLEDDETHPLELLAEGKAVEAAVSLKEHSDKIDLPLWAANAFFSFFPTKSEWAVTFFAALAQQYPAEPAAYVHLGRAYVAVGAREKALTAYRKAHSLAPEKEDALLGLRRLGDLGSRRREGEGWSVPYSIDLLLEAPTAREITLVKKRWSERDLSVKDVVIELEEEVAFQHFAGTTAIFSHTVLGSRHFGAVFVPAGAKTASCPILMVIKGVSSSYFPLDITQGPQILRTLGEESGKFAYVIPCLRGETMIFGEHRFESEGDRTNAWDGATDDAIALLSVALRMIPEVDPSRIYCFGKSRGGTIALLAGQRDHRIKGVLAWSAPTDWFALMTYGGWSMKEIVEDTLLNKWEPSEGGEAGQFVEWFVKPSIEDNRSLSEARLHILASSPLYFADLLKKTQIHHGVEDNMVPVENARALIAQMESIPNAEFEAFLHRDAGHDVEYQPDEQVTLSKSREFLLRSLFKTRVSVPHAAQSV